MTTWTSRRRDRSTLQRCSAALVGVLTLIMPLAGCGLIGSGNTVLLFGDSITVLVADTVKAEVGNRYHVEVSGTWGARIDEEADSAADLAGEDPAQVIINLGTNNLLQHHDITASIEDLSGILDTFSDVGCIHVVNLNEHINRLGEDLGPAAVAFNEKLRQLAARRLDTTVIDWNKIVVDNAAEGIMSDDGIHPNSKGLKVLAKAYSDALSNC